MLKKGQKNPQSRTVNSALFLPNYVQVLEGGRDGLGLLGLLVVLFSWSLKQTGLSLTLGWGMKQLLLFFLPFSNPFFSSVYPVIFFNVVTFLPATHLFLLGDILLLRVQFQLKYIYGNVIEEVNPRHSYLFFHIQGVPYLVDNRQKY